jgi:hypothetical protein
VRWELGVVPPEGLSAWNANQAERTGCQVAVPQGMELTTSPLGSRKGHPKQSSLRTKKENDKLGIQITIQRVQDIQ